MEWNESISLYCSFPWIVDGISPILFIQLNDLTYKREKRCHRVAGVLAQNLM